MQKTAPPSGINVPGARWIKILGAGGVASNEQIAAIFRPPGKGPFSLVVELHGDGGLKDVDIEWAARLAAAGFVVVAGCWQTSTVPPYTLQFYELTIKLIPCARLLSPSLDAVAALIAAGRMQPGVTTSQVGLYGMSSGGEVSLVAAASRQDIRAAVADSTGIKGVPPLSHTTTPILMLAGTADAYVPYTDQTDLLDALQRAGTSVEWHSYAGGRHTVILDPANKDDAMRRIIEFFTRRLQVGPASPG